MLDTLTDSITHAASLATYRALYALSTVSLSTLVLITAAVLAVLSAALTLMLSVGPVISYTPKPLLTGWERRSLAAIRRHLPSGWSVACQVRAADAVQITARSRKARWRAIRRLGLRSLDFVLLDQDTMVRAVIELDDASDRRPDRRQRDADIDHVFHAAGIPIEHVHPRPEPHWPSIIARLTTPASSPANIPAPAVTNRPTSARNRS